MEIRPVAQSVLAQNIPLELQGIGHWVDWQYELRQGANGDCKWTKVPYRPNGFHASSIDPATWSDFDDCNKAYQTTKKFDGIGFVLSTDGTYGDPFFAVDLDHCRDDLGGYIEPWAKDIIDRFGSYTEVSPSGTGIHIFGKGKLPGRGRKDSKLGLEVYDHARYMTVTGNVICL